MANKREPTPSRPTLSSSTESTNYAEPSKPNKPAPIAPPTRQEHSNPTANHAAAEPRAFLRVAAHAGGSQGSRALSPTPPLMARDYHERAGNIAVFGQQVSASLPFLKKRLMSRAFDGVEVDFGLRRRPVAIEVGARVSDRRWMVAGWEGRQGRPFRAARRGEP
jgi:hypothetical protein